MRMIDRAAAALDCAVRVAEITCEGFQSAAVAADMDEPFEMHVSQLIFCEQAHWNRVTQFHVLPF